MDGEMVVCTYCLGPKLIDEYDQRKNKAGRKSVCRECCRVLSRQSKAYNRRKRDEAKKRRPPRPPRKNNSYGAFFQALFVLGFKTYDAYLESPLWQKIRRQVFDKKGDRCVACPRLATEIHHGEYTLAAMEGKDLSQMYPVCRRCHTKAHKLTKPSLSGATRKLLYWHAQKLAKGVA